MNKFIIILIVLSLLLFIKTNHAFPLGFGAYGSGNAGQAFNRYNSYMATHDSYFIGGGLILDTYAGSDNKCGYRLNVGAETITKSTKDQYNNGNITFSSYSGNIYGKVTRINLINSLPIDIFHNVVIQLWAGPQLAFNVYCGTYRTMTDFGRIFYTVILSNYLQSGGQLYPSFRKKNRVITLTEQSALLLFWE